MKSRDGISMNGADGNNSWNGGNNRIADGDVLEEGGWAVVV